MARKVKVLRALALLTAMSGASVLALSFSCTSAKASEERLHNETVATYGLLAHNSSGLVLAKGGDKVTSRSMSMMSSLKAPTPKDRNAPEIEDPALPGYEGPGESPASARSVAR